jgi:hypothetical protein
MKFSQGCPGNSRKDKVFTEEVKTQHGLGKDAGKWDKTLFPPGSMDEMKKIISEAYDYHNEVTFPYGAPPEENDQAKEEDKKKGSGLTGVGILPKLLIQEYVDNIRNFSARLAVAVEDWVKDPQKYIDWARAEHNGTFNAKNYPGCEQLSSGEIYLDAEVFRKKMRSKFRIACEPLPVPASSHFEDEIAVLLGSDAESVDMRVRDAGVEAQKELLRRMINPVQHMAARLAGAPCGCSACKGKASKSDRFNGTLVENVRSIAELVPKLNLGDDPHLNHFAKEMEALTKFNVDTLRDDEDTRKDAAAKAAEMFSKLSGYKL